MRRRLKSLSRPATSRATSMLAAMICSSSRPRAAPASRPTAIRLNTLRRGRMASMTSPSSDDPVADRREVDVAEGGEPERARHVGRPVAGARRARSTCRGGPRRRAPGGDPRPRTARRTPPSRRPSRGPRARSVRSLTSADSLELAGALGIALGPAEGPQPERDEHGAHHDQRPDEVRAARSPACRR